MKVNVVTVLYESENKLWRAKDVARVAKMCRKYISFEHNFYCLTDFPETTRIAVNSNGIRLPLDHQIDGYFHKLEMFKPGLFEGPCIYFDLDVVIQKNIDHLIELIEEQHLRIVKTFWNEDGINSSVLAWQANSPATNNIWKTFNSNPEYYMMKYRGIDGFLWFNTDCLKGFPRREIYSRAYGYDENENGLVCEKYLGYSNVCLKFKHYHNPFYSICILNNIGHEIDERKFTYIDKSAFDGLEHYWE